MHIWNQLWNAALSTVMHLAGIFLLGSPEYEVNSSVKHQNQKSLRFVCIYLLAFWFLPNVCTVLWRLESTLDMVALILLSVSAVAFYRFPCIPLRLTASHPSCDIVKPIYGTVWNIGINCPLQHLLVLANTLVSLLFILMTVKLHLFSLFKTY